MADDELGIEPDADWSETLASLADYDRTGEFVDADEAFAQLRARLIERLNLQR